jgi:small nuclear ribonucleoprotein E
MSKKGQPKSINPLAVIFKFLQNKSRVEIWLYDNDTIRLEGKILGFDEFMNIVLDETFEIQTRTKTSRPLGKLLVKGENVTLVRAVTENT